MSFRKQTTSAKKGDNPPGGAANKFNRSCSEYREFILWASYREMVYYFGGASIGNAKLTKQLRGSRTLRRYIE
jgi:hypothetical protein